MQGLVYKSTGSWYLVKDKKNSFIECKLAGKLRNSNLKSTNPVCTGDLVNIKIDKNKTPVIESVLSRKNYIIRKSVKLSKQYQIIASNIDLCFLIITVSRPLTSKMFIDRFLASNFAYNIDTCLLFNKIDDLDIEEKSNLDELFDLYSSIGYKCFKISGKKLLNLESLEWEMKNKTCVFTGHSGSGKSTLLNSIDGSLNIKTSPISSSNLTGQHTTTFSKMYDLKNGSKIIDTPGIKGFGLYDFDEAQLKDCFMEFLKYSNCKYNDCLHKDEPGCDVKSAVDKGFIAESRYKNYLELFSDLNSV